MPPKIITSGKNVSVFHVVTYSNILTVDERQKLLFRIHLNHDIMVRVLLKRASPAISDLQEERQKEVMEAY